MEKSKYKEGIVKFSDSGKKAGCFRWYLDTNRVLWVGLWGISEMSRLPPLESRRNQRS